MSLHILQNRLDSFTKPRRNKSVSKSTNNLKWPHPSHYKATPETLATAGFYFDPSPGDKDNVTCYMCNKQLSEWAKDDDPSEIHFEKCSKKCAWASVKCGLQEDQEGEQNFAFKDKNRLPTSKAMEKARLQTFTWENKWPHDKTNNHSVDSKNMARAGFIYQPTEEKDDDTVVCMYCGVSLSGWDENDDPTEEHRKRVSSAENPCPMFQDIGSSSLKASTLKSKSKQKSTHIDILMPVKDYDGPEDEEEAPAAKASSTSKTPRRPKSATRGTKTPAARNRSSSRSRQIPIEDDDDDASSRGVTPAPPPKAQKQAASTHKRTRSRSKSVAPPQTDTDEDVVVQAPARTTRARGKSKGVAETDSDDQGGKAKSHRVRSKSKSRVSVIPEDHAAERENEEDDEQPRPQRKAKGKETKGNAKVTTSTRAEMPNDDPPPRTRKTSRAPKPDTIHAAKVSQLENLGAGTSKKTSNHKRTASSASQKGKSRVSPPVDLSSDSELDIRMKDIQPVMQPPPPTKSRPVETKPKSKAAAAGSKSRVERDTDSDPEIVDDPLDLVPPPSKTRPPLSRVASTTSKAPSSTGSEATGGVSRTKVKALASRYESEEPPAPPKSFKSSQQPASHAATANAVSLPSHRPAVGRSASSKPPSAREHTMTHSRSESDWERREVDMELQLVEISSDEEDESGVKSPSPKKPKRKVKKVATQEEEKENKRGEMEQVKERTEVHHTPHEAPDHRKVDAHAHTDDRPPLKEPVSKEKREEKPVVEQALAQPLMKDVEMADSQEDASHFGVVIPVGRPVTPPKVTTTPSFPPKTPYIPGTKGSTVPPTPGVQFFPPLSKEPFINLETLSNDELDMTVEGWIRYQMGIEYEKFKKDGENELAAFQSRVDEVRRTIEAL
ncbi:BIR-domain-containing protein [Marasmius fiardii PR-910]|nr:BIR-domain-containing protein [Marasmius fiardii PR-910]